MPDEQQESDRTESSSVFVVVAAQESRPTVQQEGAQVVVVGRFNPAVFSPSWFEAHQMVGPEQAADAAVQVIMPRLAVFRVGWLACQVDDNRLTLSTETVQEFGTLRDVAIGVLTTLPHTPISVMGLNRFFHVLYPNVESWHRVGDVLTPKETWEGLFSFAGMQSVAIQGSRGGQYPGAVNVMIQPSNVVRPGVFISTNDHFVLRVDETPPKTRNEFVELQTALAVEEPSEDRVTTALQILNKEWTASMDRADAALQRVLTL